MSGGRARRGRVAADYYATAARALASGVRTKGYHYRVPLSVCWSIGLFVGVGVGVGGKPVAIGSGRGVARAGEAEGERHGDDGDGDEKRER